jgi:hypothetical protein
MFRNAISLVLAALALAGCGRDEVKTYRVAREDSALPNQTVAPVQGGNPQPQLQFVLPANWTQIAPSQMRAASFVVTNANGQSADIGIIPLPNGEDELALVNMWREQMQLPVLTNETGVEMVSVGNDPAKLFDIASDAPLMDGKFRARIVVAELARGATNWFFKMTGEDSFVTSQKENFLQFLKSVSFAENSPTPTAEPETQRQKLDSIWKVPSGWQQLPPSEFLVAKFLIQDGDAKAEVNVSELAGEGGGLLANANRWRGQVGLEPLKNKTDMAQIVPGMDLPDGGHLTLVDFTGTDSKTGQPVRLVGAVVPQNGQTWFYKLMGDETVVAQQKDAFIQFIQSADYSNAR